MSVLDSAWCTLAAFDSAWSNLMSAETEDPGMFDLSCSWVPHDMSSRVWCLACTVASGDLPTEGDTSMVDSCERS